MNPNSITLKPMVEFGTAFADWDVSRRAEDVPEECVPPWVPNHDGYERSVRVYRPSHMEGRKTLVARYMPNDPKMKGFAMLFIMGNLPIERMKDIWETVSKHLDEYDPNNEFYMYPKGEIYGREYMPTVKNLTDAMNHLTYVYEDWEKFPNAKDYETVRKLIQAEKDIESLNQELEWHHIQRDIDDKVSRIKSLQESVVELEKSLNAKYEKGADAANLLEEHGYGDRARLWQESDGHVKDNEEDEEDFAKLIDDLCTDLGGA